MVVTWFILAAIAIPGFLCTLWIIDQDGPTADAERRAAMRNETDSGVEEEEMSLLNTGENAKRASLDEHTSGASSSSTLVGDEEEAVTVDLLSHNLVAIDGAAVGPHTASTSGAEIVVEQLQHVSGHGSGKPNTDLDYDTLDHGEIGGEATQILDRPISPVVSLRPRPSLSRKNSAASTGRSSLDPAFGARSTVARLRSPTPSRGVR